MKIFIENATLDCHIGVTKEERSKSQEIFLDIEISLNTQAGKTDDIKDTVNYTEVNEVAQNAARNKYRLIEALAENIAEGIIKRFKVQKVIVRVKKPGALSNAKFAGVEVVRE